MGRACRGQNRAVLGLVGTTATRVDASLLGYDFRVAVFGSDRPVWRRIRVSGGMSLRSLNRVIRRVFDWPVSNEYGFGVRRPWDGQGEAALVGRIKVRVGDTVGVDEGLSFEYLIRDGWRVDAVVENVFVTQTPVRVSCLAGAGSVGHYRERTPEYCDLCRAVANPGWGEHERAMEVLREGLACKPGGSINLEHLNKAVGEGRYAIVAPEEALVHTRRRRRRGRFLVRLAGSRG